VKQITDFLVTLFQRAKLYREAVAAGLKVYEVQLFDGGYAMQFTPIGVGNMDIYVRNGEALYEPNEGEGIRFFSFNA
jgi:hypothetical protein